MIRQCIPIPQKIYKITKKRLRTFDDIEKYFPGFISFIDSTTEREIPRPVDKKRRDAYYSGKKKRHTDVKTQFVVNNHGIIMHKKQPIRKEECMTMTSIKIIII